MNEALDFSPAHAAPVTALDDALTTLAAIDPEQLSLPVHAGLAITRSQPLMVKWRDIRVRPL